MAEALSIGRLAKAAGVGVETIRYYQRRGLTSVPPRPTAGRRCYGREDLDGLRFIRRAQAVGFSLAEIGILLRLRGKVSCAQTRALAEEKLSAVEARLAELRALRRDLKGWIDDCDRNTQDGWCPTLDALEGDRRRQS